MSEWRVNFLGLFRLSVVFLSSGIVLFCFLLLVILFPFCVFYYLLFDFSPFVLGMGLDNYTVVFLFILLLISCSIMFFSSFYMRGDLKNTWFLVILLLFIIRIILLSLSSRIFVIFIAWDGLGVTRFFLVMYYLNWDRISGAMVTVLTNRLGDYCLF